MFIGYWMTVAVLYLEITGDDSTEIKTQSASFKSMSMAFVVLMVLQGVGWRSSLMEKNVY